MIASDPFQIVLRQADVRLVYPETGEGASPPVDFGLVKEVKMALQPVTVGRDSHGRTQVAGYDAKITFKMMQTSNETIMATVGITSPGRLLISAGDNSLSLPDVLPVFNYDIDGAGGESAIVAEADCMISREQLADLLSASGDYYY